MESFNSFLALLWILAALYVVAILVHWLTGLFV